MQDHFVIEFTEWLTATPLSTVGRLRQLVGDPTVEVPELQPWLTGSDEHDLPIRIVAAMHSLHPHRGESDPTHNFGWSARRLRWTISPQGDSRGVAKQFRSFLEVDMMDAPDPHGIERRFMQTMDGSLDEIMTYATWFARMFRLYDVPVNWAQLVGDLISWSDPDTAKAVKRAWSVMFWGGRETIKALKEKNYD